MATEAGLRLSLIRSVMQSRDWSDAALADHMHVNRSTVHRWLKTEKPKRPRTEEECLRLAAALDIDPVLLLDFDVDSFPSVCSDVAEALGAGKWEGPLHVIRFVGRFVVPATSWPPKDIASRYPIKSWQLFEFAHDPRVQRDYYAPIVIHGRSSRYQVWHFAYRDKGLLSASPWRHYGFVWWHEDRLELYTFHGFAMAATTPADDDSIVVETWFGRGAAEFRVASLHTFEADRVPKRFNDVPRVRFGFAGETE